MGHPGFGAGDGRTDNGKGVSGYGGCEIALAEDGVGVVMREDGGVVDALDGHGDGSALA